MIKNEELDKQQQINETKTKLMYVPPTLIILATNKEVQSGGVGVSEHICGCGIIS